MNMDSHLEKSPAKKLRAGLLRYKRGLQDSQKMDVPLWFEIAGAFSMITFDQLLLFYNKCINTK